MEVCSVTDIAPVVQLRVVSGLAGGKRLVCVGRRAAIDFLETKLQTKVWRGSRRWSELPVAALVLAGGAWGSAWRAGFSGNFFF